MGSNRFGRIHRFLNCGLRRRRRNILAKGRDSGTKQHDASEKLGFPWPTNYAKLTHIALHGAPNPSRFSERAARRPHNNISTSEGKPFLSLHILHCLLQHKHVRAALC
jgi:hypothetical protein